MSAKVVLRLWSFKCEVSHASKSQILGLLCSRRTRLPYLYHASQLPEPRLLLFITQIEWTDEAFEMIRRQLEFLADNQQREKPR